jgi:exosortase/archaeosortase family protein
MKFLQAWKPLIIRLAIFLILLITVIPAAIIRIGTKPQISTNVLYVPVVLAGLLIAFIILKREELAEFKYKFSIKQAFLFGILAYSLFLAYILQQRQWWGVEFNVQYLVIGWLLYLIGGFLLLLAIFGTEFVKHFKKPITLSVVVVAVYSVTALLLNLASYPLTRLLAIPLAKLLSLTNEVQTTIDIAPNISAGNFNATIGPPCTGVTSLILFTGLFLFVVLLDWEKMNKKALLWIYLLGAIGMFIVAFLRLYLLFYIGANISQKFAMAGFHTNAGWLLFVGYFLIYFWFMYPKMLSNQHRKL